MPLLRQVVHQSMTENVRMALDTLRTNKLRSALTLLSISVAVTTLIAVVAMLMGLDQSIQESIQSYGTNTAFFSHLPSGPRFGRLSKEERQRKPLDYDDFLAVREFCKSCANVTVSLFNGELNWARNKGEEVSGLDFRGTTADFFSVYANAVVTQGRGFTESENEHRVPIVVIGEDLAKGLFPNINPIGKDILISGQHFEVLGVFQKPKGGLGGPDNSDTRAVVPYWTFRKMYPQAKEHGIRIEAFAGQLDVAIDQSRVALRRTRKVAYDKPDDFDFQTSASLIESFHSIVGMVALAVIVIASVGLMIGGIGVMNIMLVSVTERTSEIGLRKALGATPLDLFRQFVIEAGMLTALGGLLGVATGLAVGYIVPRAANIAVHITPLPVFVAVGVAVVVGLVFGVYPALRAARLAPIEALRAQ